MPYAGRWETVRQAEDYLYAKLEQSQFLDEKRIKPGLQTYERP